MISRRRLENPAFWIIAGPNGSGKSTLYETSDIQDYGRSIWIINPDILASRIFSAESLDPGPANAEALNRIRAWLDASIASYQTVGVETVLSTAKYRDLVLAAKARGFEFRLLYIYLRNVEENIERIRDRVVQGGHDVPEVKIRERRQRSFAQLPWFFREADQATIYDNSGANPKPVAVKIGTETQIDPSLLPELAEGLDLGG